MKTENQLIPARKAVQNTEWCGHCAANKDAPQPLSETVNWEISAQTLALYERLVKGTDVPVQCAMCFCVRQFMGMSDDDKIKMLLASNSDALILGCQAKKN